MFERFGAIASLMGNLPKIKQELEKLQERIGRLTAEGQAGGGLVTVTVNGRFEMQRCQLAAEALTHPDKEMLEDLIVAATNAAIAKVRGLVADETQRMAADLGLPPGFNLPGLT